MTIYYVDLVSGNDSTGDGSSGNPYKTHNKVATLWSTGDELRLAKTSAPSSVGSGNIVFTDGSTTVTTSVSLVGTVAVGDYIGKPSATGNGSM